MIFHKEKKLCLFMPPKNGTNTAIKFLGDAGWHMVKPLGHIFPEKAMENYPNLAQYKYFSFIRNPLKRFESAILFLKQKDKERFQIFIERNGINESIESTSYDQVVDAFSDFNNIFKVLVAPQSRWSVLPNTELLDFDNIGSELRRISGVTDSAQYPIPWENKTDDWGKSVVTDKVRAFVREHYASDYQLAKDKLGKDYAS